MPDAVQERLSRLDGAAVQARKGGRPGKGDFLLASVAFCGRCGAPMRWRRYRNGSRRYRCSGSMEGRAGCTASPVRAEVAESRVLLHLTGVVGEQLAAWLAERAAEHQQQRDALAAVVHRERGRLSASPPLRACRRSSTGGFSTRAKSADDADTVNIEGAADIGGPADWLARTEAHAEAINGVQTGPETFPLRTTSNHLRGASQPAAQRKLAAVR